MGNENTDPKKLVELLFGISQEDTEEFASKKGYDVDDEVIEVLNESVQEIANTQGYEDEWEWDMTDEKTDQSTETKSCETEIGNKYESANQEKDLDLEEVHQD